MGIRRIENVSLVLALVAITACSKSGGGSAGAGSETVPTVNGLVEIQPEFNSNLKDSVAASGQTTKQKKAAEAERAQTLAQARRQYQESLIEKTDLEKRLSATKTEIQKSASDDDLNQLRALDLNRDGEIWGDREVNSPAFNARYPEIESARAELVMPANDNRAIVRQAESEIAQLSYWALATSNKKAELQKKIDSANEKIRDLNLKFEKLQTRRTELAHQLTAELKSKDEANYNHRIKMEVRAVQLRQALADLSVKIANQDSQMRSASVSVPQKAVSNPAQVALQEQLNQTKLAILTEYEISKTLDIQKITEATLMQHLLAFGEANPEFDKAKSALNELVTKSQNAEIVSFKSTYEKALAEANGGKKLIYNRDAITVQHPFSQNRIQCYSGTNLFLLLNELKRSPFANTVVIFTKGHVLPGYIATNKEGKLNLFGVETTSAGTAKVDFGATATVAGDIRVFDARQFLFVELFKNDLKNFGSVYEQMLKTVSAYKFDTTKFKPLDVTSRDSKGVLNSSLLGFGQADVASGDIAREESDLQINLLFQPSPKSNQPETAPIEGERFERAFERPLETCQSLAEAPSYFAEQPCRFDGSVISMSEFMKTITPSESFEFRFTDKKVFHEKLDNQLTEPTCVALQNKKKGGLQSLRVKMSAEGWNLSLTLATDRLLDKMAGDSREGSLAGAAELTGHGRNDYYTNYAYAYNQKPCHFSYVQDRVAGTALKHLVITVACQESNGSNAVDFSATVKCSL